MSRTLLIATLAWCVTAGFVTARAQDSFIVPLRTVGVESRGEMPSDSPPSELSAGEAVAPTVEPRPSAPLPPASSSRLAHPPLPRVFEGVGGSWSSMLMLSILSLAPAILLMTTCYVRITVVLGLLRQALGMNQLPPTQVLTALSLFMTALVMTPVWTDVYQEAIVPYRDSPQDVPWEEVWSRGVRPLRKFMSRQIDRADNSEDVWLFYGYLPESQSRTVPRTYDDVPLQALLPAFLLSELKVAFLIGFQICLPFLIVDLVTASVMTSMGMMMVPPGVVSLPLKLLLFVLLDGWRLVVGMLLESFALYT